MRSTLFNVIPLLCALCSLSRVSTLSDCASEADLEIELAKSQSYLNHALEELQRLQDESIVWTQRVIEKVKTQDQNLEDGWLPNAAPLPASIAIESPCTDKDHLRLVNGSTNSEGRVEVKFGDLWMSVCEDNWSQSSAQLVCSMLGFPGRKVAAVGGRVFGNGNNQVLPSSGTCTSSAGVICGDLDNYPVRLVNGSNAREGRVEIEIAGQWGSICSSSWDYLDAKVVCRMLGYEGNSALATANDMFGAGPTTHWGMYFGCNGAEDHLMSCNSASNTPVIGSRVSCGAGQSAGVICGNFINYHVRLVNGTSRQEGHVQVFMNDRWRTIFDAGWDNNDASVVCSQLGFQRQGATAVVNSAFGHSTGTSDIGYFNCRGNEHHLMECPMSYPLNYTTWNTVNDAAGVRCLE